VRVEVVARDESALRPGAGADADFRSGWHGFVFTLFGRCTSIDDDTVLRLQRTTLSPGAQSTRA
jgi:hypothetical protein